MRVLSLDTTTRAGSVALVDAGRVVDERSGDGSRTHAERLPGEMLALLGAHGLTLAGVDVFTVASGPGSFTGLRIGIATMQGAAFVHGRPVIGVSALSALGQIGSVDAQPGDLVAAWMDAHRRDVFSALYRVGAADPFDPSRLVEIEAPMVGDPVTTLDRWQPYLAGATTVFLGDGAVVYAETIGREARGPHQVVRDVPLLAGAIGRMALTAARTSPRADASGLQPLYVRRPDAEIDRDRKALTKLHTKDPKG